ncbi:MAG: tripartite tricarboxylate transporter substrate binding protein [Betaproteobacteria bacterium]|nr:tripartite tricarboxylate transporter substrate binding protein [Betaproteobacteria bacterium]
MRKLFSAALIAALFQIGNVTAQTPAAGAQAYPARLVRFVVPFGAGGGVDMFSRSLAQRMREQSGYTIVVENISGADGNIGADLVAKAPADGYTVLMSAVTLQIINSALQPKLPYDLVRDFAPISLGITAPLFLVVHHALPAKDLKEFNALAKARAGKLSYGSSGTGSSLHLAGVMLDKATGNETLHVPYKGGGPMMLDLTGGHIDYAWQLLGVVQPSVDSGKIRLLGVAALKRHPSMPNVPTLAEQGLPGFEAETVYGVMVPKATPRTVQEKLNADVVKALESADIKKKFLDQGMESFPSTQEAFANYLQTNIAKYTKIVRESGIKKD